tara:strand:+ start:865 stop:1098 length:234 start_codon:yes stop_codon:yes gene_type:complete
MDGACAVDLWSALAGIVWSGPDGETVSYSFRSAASAVAWVREDGDDIAWYCSGPPAVVAPWIATAMADKRWHWSLRK